MRNDFVVRAQGGGPQKDERIHRRLEERLHRTKIQHLLVVENGMLRRRETGFERNVSIYGASIFCPRQSDDNTTDCQKRSRGVKRRNGTKVHISHQIVRQQARDDRHHTVADEDRF